MSYKILKKVYWNCEGITEYFESINGGEWVEKTKEYGDSVFNLNNDNHLFIFQCSSYDNFLKRKNGMVLL